MAMPALTGARENRPAGIEGEVQPQADGHGPGLAAAESRRPAVVIKTERADGVEGGGVAGLDSLDLPAGRLRGVPRGEEAQVPVECNLRPLVDVLRLGRHEMHFRQPRKLLLVLAGGLPQGLAGDVERILRGDELGSREVEPRLGLFDVGDRDQSDLEPLPTLRELLLERLQGCPCEAELVLGLQHPEVPLGHPHHEILVCGGVERVGPRDPAVGLGKGDTPIAAVDRLRDFEGGVVGSKIGPLLLYVVPQPGHRYAGVRKEVRPRLRTDLQGGAVDRARGEEFRVAREGEPEDLDEVFRRCRRRRRHQERTRSERPRHTSGEGGHRTNRPGASAPVSGGNTVSNMLFRVHSRLSDALHEGRFHRRRGPDHDEESAADRKLLLERRLPHRHRAADHDCVVRRTPVPAAAAVADLHRGVSDAMGGEVRPGPLRERRFQLDTGDVGRTLGEQPGKKPAAGADLEHRSSDPIPSACRSRPSTLGGSIASPCPMGTAVSA